MIIFRYLVKELSSSLIAATMILLLIFLSSELVRYLGHVATGDLPLRGALYLVAYEVPVLLGLLLPFGLFLSIILVSGRLHADNEMVVLHAGGMSKRRWLVMNLCVALVIAIIVGMITLWISPWIIGYKDRLIRKAAIAPVIETILPGHFQGNEKGDKVYYVSKITPDRRHMEDLFIAQQNKTKVGQSKRWTIISADRGHQEVDRKTGARFLVTTNGYVYKGVPGQLDFRITKYSKGATLVRQPEPGINPNDQDAMTTAALFRRSPRTLSEDAQIQWRFAIPISVFVLTLIAVPLSRVRARSSRYSQLMPALIIYIFYANFLFAGSSWISSGVVSPILGMWWIHAVFLLVAAWCLTAWFRDSSLLKPWSN